MIGKAVSTHCIAMLETEVKVVYIQLHIRKYELST
jgi:hypothetical protein